MPIEDAAFVLTELASFCGQRGLEYALWVAFHGCGAEHDRQLHRPGAFEETCLAVRRAQECVPGTGASVFLTKPGLRDFNRLLAVGYRWLDRLDAVRNHWRNSKSAPRRNVVVGK